MRLLRRWLVVAGALAAVLAATSAAGADESRPRPAQAEAWYPSGIGTLLAPTRPAGTLHVGMIAGQETDRAYLRFPLSTLPADAELEGVILTVPVSEASGPETATILACAVPRGFDAGGGGEAPDVNCDSAPELRFVAGPAPVFTGDLTPLAAGDAVDVALVPGSGDSWHVSFDSHQRDGGNPPTVTMEYSVPTPATPPASVTPVPAPRTDPPSSPAPPAAVPDVVPDPVPAGQVIADEAEMAPPSVITAVPVEGSTIFSYSAVFALPLALLVVVAVMGDGLTRPVRLSETAR